MFVQIKVRSDMIVGWLHNVGEREGASERACDCELVVYACVCVGENIFKDTMTVFSSSYSLSVLCIIIFAHEIAIICRSVCWFLFCENIQTPQESEGIKFICPCHWSLKISV